MAPISFSIADERGVFTHRSSPGEHWVPSAVIGQIHGESYIADEQGVFHEECGTSQNKGQKQVDVHCVTWAVQLPEKIDIHNIVLPGNMQFLFTQHHRFCMNPSDVEMLNVIQAYTVHVLYSFIFEYQCRM